MEHQNTKKLLYKIRQRKEKTNVKNNHLRCDGHLRREDFDKQPIDMNLPVGSTSVIYM